MSGAVQLVRDPIDPAALMARVARPAHGALILFLGVVRGVNDGRGVTGIEYSAYEGMAARPRGAIADRAGRRGAGGESATVQALGAIPGERPRHRGHRAFDEWREAS